ncbi:MAG: YihY/virulence factor BrkB family protein [Flavobacterium sp.]|jgi:membrane protein
MIYKIWDYIVNILSKIKLNWLENLSLYELLNIYITGILKGAFSYRAGAIAFSFFMALFPFTLFILNLLPFIPIPNFQEDFLEFVSQGVPPTTYDAIASIIEDILTNSYQGLLSSGFILSIFLMTNGINAILGGFETSYYIISNRGFVRQYFVALLLSLLLSFILLLTVAVIVVFEVIIQKIEIPNMVNDNIPLLKLGRSAFVIIMLLTMVSLLFKFGTKQTRFNSFISIGSVFTTILIIVSSYVFGIYVVKFAKYNELYGSIGTLLIFMFFIWINCMVLLLGFELNAAINNLKLKERNKKIAEILENSNKIDKNVFE